MFLHLGSLGRNGHDARWWWDWIRGPKCGEKEGVMGSVGVAGEAISTPNARAARVESHIA